MTYSEAYSELQTIVDLLKQEEVSVDDMKKHITKARALISYCQNKLREIEEDLSDTED